MINKADLMGVKTIKGLVYHQSNFKYAPDDNGELLGDF